VQPSFLGTGDNSLRCRPSSGFVLSVAVLVLVATSRAQNNCQSSGPQQLSLSVQQVYRCLGSGTVIRYAKLSGPGLIERLGALRAPVRIEYSEIEGGLDFSVLKAADSSDEPAQVTGKSQTALAQVTVALDIRHSRIGKTRRIDVENQPLSIDGPNVVFREPVNLTGSVLEGGARFSHTTFLKAAAFSDATFGKRVTFDGAWFGGKASFKKTKFLGTSLFTYSRFALGSDFSGSEFTSAPVFAKSRFCSASTFRSASFPKGASFVGSIFASGMDLTGVESENALSFSGSEIGMLRIGLDYGGEDRLTNLDAALDFGGANIRKASIRNVIFARPVSFSSARFGQAGVSNALRNANTWNDPRITGSAFHIACGGKNPDENTEASPASDTGTEVSGGQRDDDKQVDDDQTEQQTTPPATAKKPKTKRATKNGGKKAGMLPELEAWDTYFDMVRFRDDLSFADVIFEGSTSLSNLTVRGNPDFSDVRFKAAKNEAQPRVRLVKASLSALNISWEAIPKASAFVVEAGDPPLSSMFDDLESGFRARNRSSDALKAREARGWMEVRESLSCLARPFRNTSSAAGTADQKPETGKATVRGNDSTRHSRKPRSSAASTASPSCGYWASAFRLILLPIWGLSSGFGTSLGQLSIWVLFLDLLFATVYARFGRIVRTDAAGGTPDSAMRLRFLEPPSSYAGPGRDPSRMRRLDTFREAFALSTVVLLRFGAKNTRIYGEVGRFQIRHILLLEWLLGVSVLVDLVYTLQSQPFVQRILKGAIG